MEKHLYTAKLQASLQYYDKIPEDIILQHDGDLKHQSHQAKDWLKRTMILRPSFGLLRLKRTMILRPSFGLLNLQTSIPLSICGVILRGGLESMKGHQVEC